MGDLNIRIQELNRSIEAAIHSALADDWDRSIAQGTEIVSSEPGPDARRVLAKAYLGKANFVRDCKAKYAECMDLYEKAIATDPTLAQAYIERAKVFEGRGEQEQAKTDKDHAFEILGQMLEQDPRNAQAFYFRAQLYKGTGDKLQAVRELDGCIEVSTAQLEENASTPVPYRQRAKALEMKGELTWSIEWERDPDRDFAELWAVRDQFREQALADRAKAIELRVDDPESLVQRARLCLDSNQYDAAITDAQKAIGLDARHRQAYDILAQASSRKQDWDVPLAAVTHLTDENPSEPEFLKLRAKVHRDRGYGLREKDSPSAMRSYDLAIADLNRAIDLDPSDADAVRRRQSVYAARAEISGLPFDWELAIADATRQIELDGIDLAGPFAARARCYEASGQLREAIADLSEAIALKSSAPTYQRRGDMYRNAGDAEKALQDYELILSDPAYDWYDKGSAYETLIKWAIEERDYDLAIGYLERCFSDFDRTLGTRLSSVVHTALDFVEEQEDALGRFEFAKQIIDRASNALAVYALDGIVGVLKYGNLCQEEKEGYDYDRLIEKVGKVGPLIPAQVIYRAKTLRYLDEYDRALADLNALLAQHPANQRAKTARTLVYIVRARDGMYDEGGVERAISECARAIKEDPNAPEIYEFRSECYVELRDYDQATADLTRAIQLRAADPRKLAEAYAQRAKVYLKIEDLDAALADSAKAIEAAPSGEKDRFLSQRAELHSQTKHYRAALEDLTQAITIRADPTYLQERARVYGQLEQRDAELQDINEAIRLTESKDASLRTKLLVHRGCTYSAMGDLTGAIKDFGQALADAEAHDYVKKPALKELLKIAAENEDLLDRVVASLGKYLPETGDYFTLSYGAVKPWLEEIADRRSAEQAVRIVQQIMKAPGSDVVRAIFFVELERLVIRLPYEVRKKLESMLLSGFHVNLTEIPLDLLEPLADAFRYANDYAHAISAYNRVMQTKTEDPRLYAARGDCYAEIGYHEEAATDYSKAIELTSANGEEPWEDPIELRLARLHSKLGRVYRDMKEYDKAIVEYTRAIALDPGQAYRHMSRGLVYEYMDDYAEAVADCERAAKIDPKNEDIQEYLEHVRQKLRDQTETGL